MKNMTEAPHGSPRTKVWVISLSTAQTRRETFSATAKEAGMAWDFYDACNGIGPELAYNDQQVKIVNNRPLQKGELGCYSSHYQLWAWLENNTEYDQMVVIEDDVAMDWIFLSEFCKTNLTSKGIDYLRLFAKMPSPWKFVTSPFFDKYRHLIQFTGYPLGTQAYVVTREGARKFRENGQNITAAVDVYMDRTWEHGVMNLAIFPFPAYERYQPSSIGESRFNSDARSTADFLRSLLPKIKRRMSSAWLTHGFESAQVRQLRRRLNETSK